MKWLPVRGYRGLYEVSELGDVRSVDRLVSHPRGGLSRLKGKLLRQAPDKDGRPGVTLSRSSKTRTLIVSHLVAAAFIGERPNGLFVCHNDGNQRNNDYRNLRYDTPLANTHDKVIHGTQTRGDEHPTAKLTEAEVIALRLLAPHVSREFLAKAFKISKTHVQQLITYKRWAHCA